LKVSSEKIEGCRVALNIEVEPEEMEKALEGAYRRLVSKTIVPGFRKGKAPRPMLERHIGREALVKDALDRLVPELYEQAIKEQEIGAIGQPEMEMTQAEPPIFKATVPVRPVVELGDYRAIKVTPEAVEITDDEVNEVLENLRHTQALWEPVEREAHLGDLVAIDVEGMVEGKTVLDNKGSQYQLSPNSAMPVPGFAEQIVGMRMGEEKAFILPFPEDFSTAELVGKECHFRASISEVKEEHLPELDDEFVKGLGQDLETLEQLRERIANNLKAVAEQEAKSKLESQVMEAVVGLANLEFPAILTEQEIDRMAREQTIRFGGITEEEFRHQARPVAERRIANSLVIGKVCEEEKIEVNGAETDAEVERRVQSAGEQGEQTRQTFSSPEARESLQNELLTRKTIDRLIELATTEDVGPGEEIYGESA